MFAYQQLVGYLSNSGDIQQMEVPGVEGDPTWVLTGLNVNEFWAYCSVQNGRVIFEAVRTGDIKQFLIAHIRSVGLVEPSKPMLGKRRDPYISINVLNHGQFYIAAYGADQQTQLTSLQKLRAAIQLAMTQS